MSSECLEVYFLVRNLIRKPNSLLSKVIYTLLQYNDIDKEDLIHEFMVHWLEFPSPAEKFSITDRLYNFLRRMKQRMNKRPQQVSINDLEYFLRDQVPDEPERSTNDDCDVAYTIVCSQLNALEKAVLERDTTIRDAATVSGIKYDTFQKRLYRKKQSIRKDLTPITL